MITTQTSLLNNNKPSFIQNILQNKKISIYKGCLKSKSFHIFYWFGKRESYGIHSDFLSSDIIIAPQMSLMSHVACM